MLSLLLLLLLMLLLLLLLVMHGVDAVADAVAIVCCLLCRPKKPSRLPSITSLSRPAPASVNRLPWLQTLRAEIVSCNL